MTEKELGSEMEMRGNCRIICKGSDILSLCIEPIDAHRHVYNDMRAHTYKATQHCPAHQPRAPLPIPESQKQLDAQVG